MENAFDTASDNSTEDFIRDAIQEDIDANNVQTVVTRFPPEPNGYLHIGHAKSICLNFDIAEKFNGRCHLRFDDTNPSKEEAEFIRSIITDVSWLGFDWGRHLYHTSDYFLQLYQWAENLVESGNAYVDDLSAAEIREFRGTLTEPGRDSPYRERSVLENLGLFRAMRDGEFPDGKCVLRAKIDMHSPNMNLRDPVLYRISRAEHPRTGVKWCIYPTYDFAHGQSDAIEGVTHSLCTLEFEDHRPLYKWLIGNLPVPCQPKQYEFSRLNLTYTVLSKRRLTALVDGGYVAGWDDPRMPTLSGLRRRGVPSSAIKNFVRRLAISKNIGRVEVQMLDYFIRDSLNVTSKRYMGVLDPIKVTIENYPKGKVEKLEAINNPENLKDGTRWIAFSREIYIERDDFMENPPKKFFRLAPGREVRLRYAYFITCVAVIKDSNGEIIELKCVYDPKTRGGNSPDGRKVKATMHWVSVPNSVKATVRLIDHLYSVEEPQDESIVDDLNPNSLVVKSDCRLEPAIADINDGETFQLERLGYFCFDALSQSENLILNRTIGLRDTWAKTKAKVAG